MYGIRYITRRWHTHGLVVFTSLCLLCLNAHCQTGQPPTILTVSAPNVTESNALLIASFFPNSANTVRAWFNWGTTTNLSAQALAQVFAAGTNSIVFSNVLSGL